jgi:succinyl-CoA synthetase beta subunit
MNIHEYQAKVILKRFKVPVSEGVVIEGTRDGITYKSEDQVAAEAAKAVETYML